MTDTGYVEVDNDSGIRPGTSGWFVTQEHDRHDSPNEPAHVDMAFSPPRFIIGQVCVWGFGKSKADALANLADGRVHAYDMGLVRPIGRGQLPPMPGQLAMPTEGTEE